MAHQVLSKDMKELVNAMRLAEKYSSTTLDVEYKKYEGYITLNGQKVSILTSLIS